MKIEIIVTDFMGSNCYILVDDVSYEAILIDPGGSIEVIQQKLNTYSNIDLKSIINTHGHIDHIACDKEFNLPVWIHQNDVSYLNDPRKNLSGILNKPTIIKNPISILKDNDVLTIGKLKVYIIHTPGHTPGSICLKVDQSLFTGDTLFYERIGRTDFPESSFKDLKESVLNKLFVLEDDIKIYPGHGPASTIKHEKYNNPFITCG